VISDALGIGCSRGLTFDADVSSDDAATVARGVALIGEGVTINSELGGILYGTRDEARPSERDRFDQAHRRIRTEKERDARA
jgi:hypothetical protein